MENGGYRPWKRHDTTAQRTRAARSGIGDIEPFRAHGLQTNIIKRVGFVHELEYLVEL